MSGENLVRLEWLRGLPCCARNLDEGGCSYGCVEAHHPRGLEYGTGTGVKASDEDAVPLCHRHHTDWHLAVGVFSRWHKKQRKEWQRQMVELYHQAWEVQQNICLPVIPLVHEEPF